MKFCNYKFIKIGCFVKSKTPLSVVYEGRPDTVTVELLLDNDNYRNIAESVYLVVVQGVVRYIGEYSKSLGDRWFKRTKDNYIWHHQDINIHKALNNGNEVCLYLLDNPYLTHSNGRELNVAKAIEHDILQRVGLTQKLWNKRNKNLKLAPLARINELSTDV